MPAIGGRGPLIGRKQPAIGRTETGYAINPVPTVTLMRSGLADPMGMIEELLFAAASGSAAEGFAP